MTYSCVRHDIFTGFVCACVLMCVRVAVGSSERESACVVCCAGARESVLCCVVCGRECVCSLLSMEERVCVLCCVWERAYVNGCSSDTTGSGEKKRMCVLLCV